MRLIPCFQDIEELIDPSAKSSSSETTPLEDVTNQFKRLASLVHICVHICLQLQNTL